MALTVQYGPISTALSLAKQAGEGQRYRQQQQADLQFINMVNQQKAQADSAYANQIQTALNAQHQQDALNLEAQDQGQRIALAKEQAQADAQARQGQLAIQQQNANTSAASQQATATHLDKADQTAAYKAQHPTANSDNEQRLLLAQDIQNLRNSMAAELAKQKQLASQKDLVTGAPVIPPENQAAFKQSQAVIADLQAKLKTRSDALSQMADSILIPGQKAPAVDPAKIIAAQQQAAQQQPASQQSAPEVTTVQQYAALPDGAAYTYQGHVFIKGHK